MWSVVTLVALGGSSLRTQDSATDELHALQGADTSCPRATLKSFIDACNEVYQRVRGEGRSYRNDAERQAVTARALRCLDLSQVPTSVLGSVGRERAVCLKEVLDRIDLPAEGTWPDEEQVTKSEITRWRVPATDIIFAKVKEGPCEGEFLFSPETVDRAAEFCEIVNDLPYKERARVTPGMYRYFLSELIGKIAVEHVPLIQELKAREILVPPPLKPGFLSAPEFESQMDSIRSGLTLFQLLRDEAEPV